MPLDPVIEARIVALIQDGRGQRETARIVGKSLCAVQNVYQRYEETGLISGFLYYRRSELHVAENELRQ
jgi:transposase